MSEATVGQAYEILAMLANRIERWRSDLDKDRLQEEVISDPERMAKQFAEFLKNGARVGVVASLVLKLVVSFNPAEFIGPGWTIWKGSADRDGLNGDEDRDAREDALTEIDWGKVLFETCLKDNETIITGQEKLLRLKATNNVRLGGRAFLSLWQDWQKNKKNSVLEMLRKTRNINLAFFGLVLRSPDCRRCVLCLCFDGGEWRWRCYWLDPVWGTGYRSASLPSVSN